MDLLDLCTLPTHPVTGLQAMGLRRNGDPIWPVRGGAPADDELDADGNVIKPGKKKKTDDEDPDDLEDEDDEEDDEDKKNLGEPGKRALDRMKQRDKNSRKTIRELREQLANNKPEVAGDKPDAKAEADKIRAELRHESLLERVEDKIEARVAKLVDPEIAEALLRRRHKLEDFITDGRVDTDALDDAIVDLLEAKPALDPTKKANDPDEDATKRRFNGTGDGGKRQRSRPKQLTEADLDDMTDAEIDKAREDGKLADLLSGKQR
jgi:hypothetical protein